jgi:hypothetical protein
MNRTEILETAASYVTTDREQQYGPPENNFGIVARLWNIYGGHGEQFFTAEDVAVMMCLLKIARIASGQKKEDNYVDLAGYAACAGEIATGAYPVKDYQDPFELVDKL